MDLDRSFNHDDSYDATRFQSTVLFSSHYAVAKKLRNLKHAKETDRLGDCKSQDHLISYLSANITFQLFIK
jgi:hypothetical protein